jgi:Pentapeptide repeats (8 copies)
VKFQGIDLLVGTNLRATNLNDAKLRGANLGEANLRYTSLRGADLSKANLIGTMFVQTDLANADLTGCFVFGISAWKVGSNGDTKQRDLVITAPGEPELTTDDIEVAQFLHLLLHNEKLGSVIDTITAKVVLILGRFSSERKRVLDALRDELRKRDYVPVVFDFEKPKGGTTINTVVLLARMARFVIADISDAKSVLQELQAIVPTSPKLPVQPIIEAAREEPGMFDSFEAYTWFLKVHRYNDSGQLLAQLDHVIGPVEAEVMKRGA